MPKAYLEMKRKFMKEGMSEEAAESKAAAIYNSKHKENPVTRDSDEKKTSKSRSVLDGLEGRKITEIDVDKL